MAKLVEFELMDHEIKPGSADSVFTANGKKALLDPEAFKSVEDCGSHRYVKTTVAGEHFYLAVSFVEIKARLVEAGLVEPETKLEVKEER